MTWQQWLVRLVLLLTGLTFAGALVNLVVTGELANPASLVTIALILVALGGAIWTARKSAEWLANPYW
ncbi:MULTISPECIES: hypothetical protein [unclassified Haladaptatus]|uniref:hypothetical protein n=1 Tax=unclassified Haladaptatus TaxID=2622732 RepID=UPI0023E83394|nr:MULTISPECIES: hypothetical protein [unclassified Haladaptatus]